MFGSASNNSFIMCFLYRSGICSVDKRCAECSDWSPKHVLLVATYQHAFKRRQEKAKFKALRAAGKSSPCPAENNLVSCNVSLSHGPPSRGEPYSFPPPSPTPPSPPTNVSIHSEDSISQDHVFSTLLWVQVVLVRPGCLFEQHGSQCCGLTGCGR